MFINFRDRLNRMAPAADDAKLGATLEDLITKHNALVADFNALITKYNAALAKLDADGGVTDTNYAATQAGTASAATVGALGTR